jgi:hypothetical protein
MRDMKESLKVAAEEMTATASNKKTEDDGDS